jgi:hypothetical protein
MNATITTTTEDHDSNPRAVTRPGVVARLARALGPGVLVASAGLLVGLGVLRATNVLRLIPQDGPQIWVRSGCGAAEAAVRAALHATPEQPVFMVPLDQNSEMAQSACRSTLAALDHEGHWWLQYFPERWLCQRFAEEASEHHEDPIPVPTFYADGRLVCDGLCDEAFEGLGLPELQQYVTFVRPSASL